MVVQQLPGGSEKSGRGHVDALALDRLDDQRSDVSLAELGCQRIKAPERDAGVGQQRVETAPELGRAVHRQRADGEPVVAVVAVDDPPPAGRVPDELQRRFHRLGAAVAEIHPVQPRCPGEQLLGQQPGQQGAVELRHVR
jgi:hypothetical protein